MESKDINVDEFSQYSVEIDAELLSQDFDDVDLYGQKMIEDDDNFSADIAFE